MLIADINHYAECFNGNAYNATLKLSGCSESEFTCDSGQCIKIGEIFGMKNILL